MSQAQHKALHVEDDTGERAEAMNVAETFLLTLRSRGVENFFINAGTDFAPIVEVYASSLGKSEDRLPRPVIAGHENVSMGMAHGAYLATGNAQALMFHVNVGTANAVCAAMNAATERVPLLVCAGRSPIYEGSILGSRNTRVAWGQEMYDQAGVIRETVKWDYELRGGAQVEDVVDRALTIAGTDPKGPVYLTLPREVLAEQPAAPRPSAKRVQVPTQPFPDPEAVGRLADRLVDAELPVISSLAAGSDPASVPLLASLCERFALGYAEEQARYLSIPDDHPLHLGHALPPILRDADALLFVECDVPWMDSSGGPKADAFVAQAGVDPNFSKYPIRSHRNDLSLSAGAAPLFSMLGDALEQRKHRIDQARHERLARMGESYRSRARSTGDAAMRQDGPIDPLFLSATLGRLIHDECVLFNEYWVVRGQIEMRHPRSYFYLPATGGLGWALPSALGMKLAAPRKTVIAAIGDGTYMFSNPAACHHASRKHDLPVLTVIANNSRWNAVDTTARMVYPEGSMKALDWMDISDLRPTPAFEAYSTASGGFGAVVSRRDELEMTLRKAFNAVENEGRQALVNVLCA